MSGTAKSLLDQLEEAVQQQPASKQVELKITTPKSSSAVSTSTLVAVGATIFSIVTVIVVVIVLNAQHERISNQNIIAAVDGNDSDSEDEEEDVVEHAQKNHDPNFTPLSSLMRSD